MQEDLNRKDNILRSCELDLSKLQQTEYLLKKKSDQLTELQVIEFDMLAVKYR